jgi:hypothetical protein
LKTICPEIEIICVDQTLSDIHQSLSSRPQLTGHYQFLLAGRMAGNAQTDTCSAQSVEIDAI